MFEFMLLFPNRLPDYRRGDLPSNETGGLGSVVFLHYQDFTENGWLVDALSAAGHREHVQRRRVRCHANRARCRVRTYKNCIQHQQFTLSNPQLDPQTCDIEKQQLTRLVKAWPKLPASLKKAILMIAASGDGK